jgi:hypothetical protein
MFMFYFCVVTSGQLTIDNKTEESNKTRGQNAEKLIEAKSQQYQNRTDKFYHYPIPFFIKYIIKIITYK